MFSRRDFGKIALAAIPLSAAAGAAKINSKVKGVQIGLQSYSFRDRPMAKAIEACKEVGLGEVELWQGHVEPQTPAGPAGREELRKWRLETPLETFTNVRHQWNDAGIRLHAYNSASTTVSATRRSIAASRWPRPWASRSSPHRRP